MHPVNHIFFEILRFPAAELLQVNSNEIIEVARGPFQVIRSEPLDTILLKFEHFKIALDKSLPMIGTFSDEEKYPAYLFPTFDGFYMFKILDNRPHVALRNLETILENLTSFSRRTGMEQKLSDIREAGIHTRMAVLREAYHMTKEAIVKTFALSLKHEDHPNYTLFRTFEDLQKIDEHTPMIDVSDNELQNARSEVKEVILNHLTNKYWVHFSQHEGIPEDTEKIILPPYKARESMFEDARTRASTGANISTVTKDIAVESQEIVGSENQRLPVYEVHSSKAHVEQGLDMASSRLDDAKFYQSCDLPPAGESQIKEDTTVTTGLMKPQETSADKRLGEPLSNFDKGGDVESQPLDADAKDQFPTELEPNPDSNLYTTLEAKGGDPYRKNLDVDMSAKQALSSDNWSNLSNPSETPALTSDLSSVSSESNGLDLGSLGSKPVVITGGLTHSQSLHENLLAGSAEKDSLKMKPNTSEKESTKQKNISDQALDKENVKNVSVV